MDRSGRTGRKVRRPRGIGGWRRREGQSLAEFAIVLPVFLLILAGIVDFGMGLYSQMTVINAAREGARLGVVQPGDLPAIEARVEAMAEGLDPTKLDVPPPTCLRPSGNLFVACTGTLWQQGDAVVVNVNYQYRMLWPLAFGNSLNLSSTVQMRIE
jgi:TadE-like protein